MTEGGRVGRSCEGFRMPARRGLSTGAEGRRPKASREGTRGGAARAVAVYGDLTAGRRERVTRWARELVVDRRLQPAERCRCCFRRGDFGVMGGIAPAFGGHDAT